MILGKTPTTLTLVTGLRSWRKEMMILTWRKTSTVDTRMRLDELISQPHARVRSDIDICVISPQGYGPLEGSAAMISPSLHHHFLYLSCAMLPQNQSTYDSRTTSPCRRKLHWTLHLRFGLCLSTACTFWTCFMNSISSALTDCP